jgi:5-methylcytosine-specific restriction protein A
MDAPCAITGCPDDAIPRRSRCRTHDRQHRRHTDHDRPNSSQRGYDRKWEATSKAYLASHPWCQCPGCPHCTPTTGCQRPSTEPDHIDGLGPNAPRGHDWTNLRGLCHPCHSHRTGRDQGGFSRR